MKLFLFEMKKLWSKKEFLLYFVLLVCINLFLLWMNCQTVANNASPSAYRYLTNDLKQMSESEKIEYLSQRLEMISAIVKIDNIVKYSSTNKDDANHMLNNEYHDIFIKYRDIYNQGNYLKYTDSLYVEYRFLQKISEEISQATKYESFLNDIQKKAQQLSQISIFNKEGSYDSLNIKATAKAYKDISGVKIEYYPQEGIVKAINFRLSDIVIIFIMLLLSFYIVREEKDSGMLSLIRSNIGGTGKTAFAKLLAMGASLFFIVAAIYIVNLIYCSFTYGLGDLKRSVQSVPYLMYSTMEISLYRYLAIFIFTKWIAAFICGTWVLFSMLISKKVFTGYVLALSMPTINLIIRNVIPATSHFNVIRYSNLVSFFATNEILGNYKNIYWFGKPVRLFWVEVIAMAVFAVMLAVIFLFTFAKAQLVSTAKGVFKLGFRKKIKNTTVLKQEWYKLNMMNGAAFILSLFCVFQCYTAYTAENYITADEMFYSYYMKNISGPYDKQAYDFLMIEGEKFATIEKAKSMLRSGEISKEEYSVMSTANFTLQQEYGVYNKVLSKVNGLKSNPGAQLLYETGYVKLFDLTSKLDLHDYLFTVLMATVCFSGLFAVEKTSGMLMVIRATPLGMKYTAQSKIKVAFIFSIILTIVTIAPRLWQVGTGYGFLGLLAPAKSIDLLASLPNYISIMSLGIFQFSIRLLVIFSISTAMLYISHKSSGYLSAVMFSLLIFEFPAILYYLGVNGAQWLTLYSAFHIVANFNKSSLAFAGWTYISVCLLIIYHFTGKLQEEYDMI